MSQNTGRGSRDPKVENFWLVCLSLSRGGGCCQMSVCVFVCVEIVSVCEDVESRDGPRVSPPVARQPCSAALLDSGFWSNHFRVCVPLCQGPPSGRSDISQGLINYLKQMKNLKVLMCAFFFGWQRVPRKTTVSLLWKLKLNFANWFIHTTLDVAVPI